MRIPVFRHGQIAALAFGIGLAGIFLVAMPGDAFALNLRVGYTSDTPVFDREALS